MILSWWTTFLLTAFAYSQACLAATTLWSAIQVLREVQQVDLWPLQAILVGMHLGQRSNIFFGTGQTFLIWNLDPWLGQAPLEEFIKVTFAAVTMQLCRYKICLQSSTVQSCRSINQCCFWLYVASIAIGDDLPTATAWSNRLGFHTEWIISDMMLQVDGKVLLWPWRWSTIKRLPIRWWHCEKEPYLIQPNIRMWYVFTVDYAWSWKASTSIVWLSLPHRLIETSKSSCVDEGLQHHLSIHNCNPFLPSYAFKFDFHISPIFSSILDGRICQIHNLKGIIP